MADSCATCFFFRTFTGLREGSSIPVRVCAREAPRSRAGIGEDTTAWREILHPNEWWCGDFSTTSLSQPINTQTASYQIVLADAGAIIEMNVGSANTLTIPANVTAPFVLPTVIDIVQIGVGQTTVVAAGGVTINGRNGLRMAGRYAMATIYKRATNEWVIGGDLMI